MYAVEQSSDQSITLDQRVTFQSVTWRHYQTLLEMRSERSSPRISYLDGKVELVSPSRNHEQIKKTLARLIEHWAVQQDLRLNGYGSWTLEDESEEAGAEPDECYSLGAAGEVPDLAIEVVWTHGGLDKLEIYRRLGVREVWIWKNERISVYELRDGVYHEIDASLLLPDIDLELLAELSTSNDQLDAIRKLSQALRGEDEA